MTIQSPSVDNATIEDFSPKEILDRNEFFEGNISVIDRAVQIAEKTNLGSVEWKNIKNKNNRSDVNLVETYIQAIVEWLVNSDESYINLSVSDKLIKLRLTGCSGGNTSGDFSIEVIDEGCGLERDELELALFKNPKEGGIDKLNNPDYLGEFGQGSLAPIGFSKRGCKFTASKHHSSTNDIWSWSITRKNSEGVHQYLTVNGQIPTYCGDLSIDGEELNHGTISKVYNINDSTPTNATKGKFLRDLGYKYPDPPTPINISDGRAKTDSKRKCVWNGLKSELENSKFFKSFEKQIQTQFGEIPTWAFVVKEQYTDDIPKKFISTSNRDRVFFMLNGLTHHTLSSSKIASKCGLDNINEHSLIFFDCSNLNIEFTNIFKTDRTCMIDSNESTHLKQDIFDEFSSWSELQEMNSSRFRVSENSGYANMTGIYVAGSDDSLTPKFSCSIGESVCMNIQVEAPEKYVEELHNTDEISIYCNNIDGDYSIDVNNNTVVLEIEPIFSDSSQFMAQIIVEDHKEDRTQTVNCTIERQKETSNMISRGDNQYSSPNQLYNTAEPTMLSFADSIEWRGSDDSIEAKVRKCEQEISLLEQVEYGSEKQMKEQLIQTLFNAPNKERYIEFLFESLSINSTDSMYDFVEQSWHKEELGQKISNQDREATMEFVEGLFQIGINNIIRKKDIKEHYHSMLICSEADRRKNRQGENYEEAVESILQDKVNEFNEKHNRNLKLVTQFKYIFENDFKEKTLDFAIQDEQQNVIVVVEANCYGSTGSKISEMVRSSRDQLLKTKSDLTYIRVTDGRGISLTGFQNANESLDGNLLNLHYLRQINLEDWI